MDSTSILWRHKRFQQISVVAEPTLKGVGSLGLHCGMDYRNTLGSHSVGSGLNVNDL